MYNSRFNPALLEVVLITADYSNPALLEVVPIILLEVVPIIDVLLGLYRFARFQ